MVTHAMMRYNFHWSKSTSADVAELLPCIRYSYIAAVAPAVSEKASMSFCIITSRSVTVPRDSAMAFGHASNTARIKLGKALNQRVESYETSELQISINVL